MKLSDGRRARKAAKQNTAVATNGMAFGVKRFIPLLALGALAVGAISLYKRWAMKRRLIGGSVSTVSTAPSFSQRLWSRVPRVPFIGRRRSLRTAGALASTSIASTSVSAPVFTGRGRLIARQRVPGERIKEVDVITRKRVPYHEEVEVFEGPASFESYQGGEREYIDNSASFDTYGSSYGTSGLEGGETVVASAHSRGAPIVNSRRVPIRDRVKSKIARRPVVTNYH